MINKQNGVVVGLSLVLVAALAIMAISTNAYAHHSGSPISVTQIINQHNMVKNGGTGTNTASNSVTISGHSTTQTQTQTQTSSQVGGTQEVGQRPINIPINICGNSVGVIGGLNPSFGNICSNK